MFDSGPRSLIIFSVDPSEQVASLRGASASPRPPFRRWIYKHAGNCVQFDKDRNRMRDKLMSLRSDTYTNTTSPHLLGSVSRKARVPLQLIGISPSAHRCDEIGVRCVMTVMQDSLRIYLLELSTTREPQHSRLYVLGFWTDLFARVSLLNNVTLTRIAICRPNSLNLSTNLFPASGSY